LHNNRWTTRQALKYLRIISKSRNNSFLKISYHRPHSPYDPPNRLYQKYIQATNITQRFVNHSSWDIKYINQTRMDDNAYMGDPGNDAAFRSRAGYLGSVEFVDEGIGQIIKFLKKKRMYHNALIMWISDHGDQNGDHYLWRKGYPYESSSRMQFILKVPTTANQNRSKSSVIPRTSPALVEIRDVAVTIYDYIGILEKVRLRDPFVNGQSLLPIFYGNVTDVRNWLDLEHSRLYRDDIHWNAIVGWYPADGVSSDELLWKYIFHVYDGSEQLFCLTKDPHETYDVSTIQFQILNYWRNIMIKQFQDERRGPTWVVNGHLVRGRKPMNYGPNYPCRFFHRICILHYFTRFVLLVMNFM
jgi:arylsulfatase